jgi:hypothetical protein
MLFCRRKLAVVAVSMCMYVHTRCAGTRRPGQSMTSYYPRLLAIAYFEIDESGWLESWVTTGKRSHRVSMRNSEQISRESNAESDSWITWVTSSVGISAWPFLLLLHSFSIEITDRLFAPDCFILLDRYAWARRISDRSTRILTSQLSLQRKKTNSSNCMKRCTRNSMKADGPR